jgi:hypothetical protein
MGDVDMTGETEAVCGADEPQMGDPPAQLLVEHVETNAAKFQALTSSLPLGPHASAALAHFESGDDGCVAPSRAVAMHVVATVWRSLVPAWDDRIAGRPERPRRLRYEDEILDGRVEAMLDFNTLILRYYAVLFACGQTAQDVLADVAVAEATVALALGWTEQTDGSWRNDEVPGLGMVAERLPGGHWFWHVAGGAGGFRATYGLAADIADARNKAVEAVTGIDPAECLAEPLDPHVLLMK